MSTLASSSRFLRDSSVSGYLPPPSRRQSRRPREGGRRCGRAPPDSPGRWSTCVKNPIENPASSAAIPRPPQIVFVADPVEGGYHLLEDVPFRPRQSVLHPVPQEGPAIGY